MTIIDLEEVAMTEPMTSPAFKREINVPRFTDKRTEATANADFD